MKTLHTFLFIFLNTFLFAQLDQLSLLSQYEKTRIIQFGLEDGLSQASTNDLLVDSKGIVWIATQDGLNSFDGTQFKHYKYDETDKGSISNNFVCSLLEDQNGNILIGTCGGGLNYFDRQSERFSKIALNEKKTSESIIDLDKDANGNIWIVSRNAGVYKLKEKRDGSFLQEHFFPHSTIYSLHIDSENQLWIGDTKGRIYLFDVNLNDNNPFANEPILNIGSRIRAIYKTKTKLLVGSELGLYVYCYENKTGNYFDLDASKNSKKYITSFLEEDESCIWIGGYNGLFLLNWEKQKVLQKIQNKETEKVLSHNTIKGIVRIAPQKLLVGTLNGLNLIDQSTPYFKNISKDKKGKHLLNNNLVFSIFKEKEDLWIGTSGGGLNLIRGNKVYYFREDKNDETSIAGDNVLSTVKDEINNRLWIGTTLGLSFLDLDTFDPNNPEFTSLYHDPNNENSINHNYIKDLAMDKNNCLWGATLGGGIFKLKLSNEEGAEIVRYKKNLNDINALPNNTIYCLEIDKNNAVWIGTGKGLSQLKFEDDNYGKPLFTNFFHQKNNPNSLSHNSVNDILVDDDNKVWIGTRYGLNLLQEDGTFQSWKPQKQFNNAFIYSIQNDKEGNLWLGTNNGLVYFNPQKNLFKEYSEKEGIQSREFDTHARFIDNDGTIYLGGIGGVTYFHPDDLKSVDQPQPLYFSSLMFSDKNNNNTITDLYPKKLKNIHGKNEVEFEHDQFPFEIKISSIDFRINKNVEYAYRLLPNDDSWHILEKPEIQFLNLSPGNYKLQVNGVSRGIIWQQNPLTMDIKVLAPWWRSVWAYIGYGLILLALIYRIYRFQLSRQLAKQEAYRLKELDTFKTRFYTNITHEFRTPLTVIKGMTKRIKGNEEEKTMILRNSDDLLNLVNQMLELSKLESGNMPIKMVNGDIVSFFKYLTESLHSLAESKGIELKTENLTPSLPINYDKNKLTHIVKNLLVNAIKFTPQYGEVILKINNNNTDAKILSFSVSDTGKGIAPQDLPNIFNRYYQTKDVAHQGTGIGLALTHELVKLLGGSIQVKSELGKGTTFNIQLPITRNEKPLLKDKERFLKKTIRTNTFSFKEKINKSSEQPILLIIEDSDDVVQYLKLCLNADYQIQTASNGKEGMKKAIELIPDIIISDVRMPEADGFEVCNFLKNDIRTSHIPLILLTAKADIESKLAGLTGGADAYLAKPFEEEELKIRMNKMLDLRKRLQEKYSNGNFSQQYISDFEFEKENQFIIELKELILEKMDTDIDYDELARLVGMSRSQFYRKIKALTDCSPSIFIRSIKLKHGDELLRTTDLTVSEVAFQTGFKDVAYFSRSYKKQFGTTPTERRHI